MNPTTANLKHFIQRPALLAWSSVLAVVAALICLQLSQFSTVGKGTYSAYLAVSLLAGLLAGSAQKEVITKPFAFTLPGHRKIPRRVLFAVGIALNASLALTFLWASETLWHRLPVVWLSSTGAGMTIYLLAVMAVFVARHAGLAMAFIYIPLAFGPLLDLHVGLESVIINQPLLPVGLGALASVCAWMLLGCQRLHRRFSGQCYVPFADAFSMEKARKYRQRMMGKKKAGKVSVGEHLLASFFLGRMRECNSRSASIAVWGTLYEIWAKKNALTFLIQGFFFIPMLAVVFGYEPEAAGDFRMGNLVFAMSVLLGLHIRLPVRHITPVPIGRRERFAAAAAASVTMAVLAGCIVFTACLASELAAPLFPRITWRNLTFTYTAFRTADAYAPLAIVPIGFACQLITKHPFAQILVIIAVFEGVLFGLSRLTAAGPLAILAAVALPWVAFILQLHRRCFKTDLASA